MKNKIKTVKAINTSSQQGFTLIELVIVVVILGFLAVTAIPKFIDLTEQAKQANIEGMAGGFATGVSLVRAQWEAEGRPTANNINRVDYDGTYFVLTTPTATSPASIREGYPTGINTSNSTGENMNDNRCLELWNGIYQQPPTITNSVADLNNSALNFDYLVDTDGNLCVFYLKETLDRNAAGNFLNPAGNQLIGNNFTYNSANSSVVVNIKN